MTKSDDCQQHSVGAQAGSDGISAMPAWMEFGRECMVACDSHHASHAGMSVLEKGGNAIDAAVAVSFALSVARPYSTGLGGGGFMIIRLRDGSVFVLDYRETAPAASTMDMYQTAASGSAFAPSRYGYLAVGVPGCVAGACEALERFGSMPLGLVIQPAIDLADGGIFPDKHHIENAKSVLREYEKYPVLKELCPFVFERYCGGGDEERIGEKLYQPELGRLLKGIAKSGPEFFYSGRVAEAIAQEMSEHGGIVTVDDLASYAVRYREPVRSTYREFEIISMPPPSSGGVALTQTLNILEALNSEGVSVANSELGLHYQIESMKHAFADRARWMGDTDFIDVPIAMLSSKEYACKLAERIGNAASKDADQYGSKQLPDDAGTSHYCVVDRWGNVVVATETINTSFGSLAAVAEWGLILNNEMDDFSAEPGKANFYGLVQSERNAVEPGKRPLSSMTPTIVLKDGEPLLMLGGSGGPRIISSVLNVLLNVLDRGMSLEQAMLCPRPHHQWMPDEVNFGELPSSDQKEWRDRLRDILDTHGHKVSEKTRTGVVQAILRTEGGWLGASDPRKGGQPAGR